MESLRKENCMKHLTLALLELGVPDVVIKAWGTAMDVRGPEVIEALIQRASYIKVEQVRLISHSYADYMERLAVIHAETSGLLAAWSKDLEELELIEAYGRD